MYPLRIVGPSDSGKTTLVERLVPALSARGSVATIKHLKTAVEIDEPGKDTYRHRSAGARVTYGLEDDGSWFATGSERDLFSSLRELAPAVDYALIEGYSGESTLPAVVLAGRDHRGPAIATAQRGRVVDIDRLISRLEAQPEIETPASLVAEARSVGGAHPNASATLSRSAPNAISTDETATISADLPDRAGVHAVRVHTEAYGERNQLHAAAVGSDSSAVANTITTVADRLESASSDERSETNRG